MCLGQTTFALKIHQIYFIDVIHIVNGLGYKPAKFNSYQNKFVLLYFNGVQTKQVDKTATSE